MLCESENKSVKNWLEFCCSSQVVVTSKKLEACDPNCYRPTDHWYCTLLLHQTFSLYDQCFFTIHFMLCCLESRTGLILTPYDDRRQWTQTFTHLHMSCPSTTVLWGPTDDQSMQTVLRSKQSWTTNFILWDIFDKKTFKINHIVVKANYILQNGGQCNSFAYDSRTHISKLYFICLSAMSLAMPC